MKTFLLTCLGILAIACQTHAQLSALSFTPNTADCNTTTLVTADVAPCTYDGTADIVVIAMPGVTVVGPNPIAITGGVGDFELQIDPGISGSFNIGFEVASITNQNGCGTWEGDSWVASFTATCSPLPLTLLDFDGSPYQSFSLLEWWTADEVQFSHFEIEHRTDVRDWSMIARVAGGDEKYSYIHRHAVGGNNYYRLKMVDLDGQYNYAPIVTIFHERVIDIATLPLEQLQELEGIVFWTCTGQIVALRDWFPAGIYIISYQGVSIQRFFAGPWGYLRDKSPH